VSIAGPSILPPADSLLVEGPGYPTSEDGDGKALRDQVRQGIPQLQGHVFQLLFQKHDVESQPYQIPYGHGHDPLFIKPDGKLGHATDKIRIGFYFLSYILGEIHVASYFFSFFGGSQPLTNYSIWSMFSGVMLS
jgi:hypothetical protein